MAVCICVLSSKQRYRGHEFEEVMAAAEHDAECAQTLQVVKLS